MTCWMIFLALFFINHNHLFFSLLFDVLLLYRYVTTLLRLDLRYCYFVEKINDAICSEPCIKLWKWKKEEGWMLPASSVFNTVESVRLPIIQNQEYVNILICPLKGKWDRYPPISLITQQKLLLSIVSLLDVFIC